MSQVQTSSDFHLLLVDMPLLVQTADTATIYTNQAAASWAANVCLQPNTNGLLSLMIACALLSKAAFSSEHVAELLARIQILYSKVLVNVFSFVPNAPDSRSTDRDSNIVARDSEKQHLKALQSHPPQ